MDFDRINSNLFVGSHPRKPEDVELLKSDGEITGVLNVQTDDDFRFWDVDWGQLQDWYQAADIAAVRVPVYDFNHVDLRRRLPACVAALEELIEAGRTVLVHCNAGINRAPSVVIAYLFWVSGWDLDDAVSHVMRRRSCDPNVVAIREATEDRRPAP